MKYRWIGWNIGPIRSPQQELLARDEAYKALRHLHSKQLQNHLATRNTLGNDWFDWWTILLLRTGDVTPYYKKL